MPFNDNEFDYVLSVAVIHHFSSSERRIEAIKELIRITKKGGDIFIQVWAFEQPETSKRKFTKQDEMVSWNKSSVPRSVFFIYFIF